VNTEHSPADIAADYLKTLPKGTVITVTHASGHSFQLIAEGLTYHDFLLHSGIAPAGMAGQLNRLGVVRHYWSVERIARWVANGMATIELKDKT